MNYFELNELEMKLLYGFNSFQIYEIATNSMIINIKEININKIREISINVI